MSYWKAKLRKFKIKPVTEMYTEMENEENESLWRSK